MTPDGFFHYAGLTLNSFFVDLLLSGDNAMIIAMACRFLPVQQQRRALLIGTGGAIVLRALLAAVAGALLGIPSVKLIGGAALIVIAIKLLVAEDPETDGGANATPRHAATKLSSAVGVIIVADLAMSIDNVVALAAVAQGNVAVLAIGLLLSVPLLMYGTWVVTGLLKRYPLLVPVGGALLGWLAGNIAMADPLLSGWVTSQAPVLGGLVPILAAGFVFAQSRIILNNRPRLLALRPKRSLAIRAAHTTTPAVVLPLAPTAPNEVLSSRSEASEPLTPEAEASVLPADAQRRPASLWRAIGIAAAACMTFGTLAFVVIQFIEGDGPDELRRYDCASPPGVSAFYSQGAGNLVLNSGTGSAVGIVSGGNIDWADRSTAQQKLGFSLPGTLKVIDHRSIRLSGGVFADAECSAR